MAYYKYMCVLDFEATCNENSTQMKEIIEFPSVLLELDETLGEYKKISEFQIFVKPMYAPKLTEFCKKLTSITQEQIDNGVTLKDAIYKHHTWILENVPDTNNCILITHGDWDLAKMLVKDCKRHNIKSPKFYKRYINMKNIAKITLNEKHSLVQMLDIAKLKFEGHQHSGLDDSRNIARIVQHMYTKDKTQWQMDSSHIISVY